MNAAQALQYKRNTGVSTRAAARLFGVIVPQLHVSAGCPDGKDCRGRGCKV